MRLRLPALVVAVLIAAVGVSVVPEQASAATVTVTVTRNYDGTGFDPSGQPTPNSCPIIGSAGGGDNSPNDGIVCTNDSFSYNWNVSIPAGANPTTVTFASTLPPGAAWDQSNVTLCQGGGSTGYTGTASITNNGQTLSCTITWAAGGARSSAIPVVIDVSSFVADGTTIAPPLVVTQSGPPTTLSSPGVVVRAAPQFDLHKAIKSLGPLPNGDVQVKVDVWATSEFLGAAAGNSRGIPELATFSFADDLSGMPAGTTLATTGNCNIGRNPSTAPGTSGTWSCTQSGPGQPVTITVTGANTSSVGSGIQPGQGPLVFAGGLVLTVPAAGLPATQTAFHDQLRSFDPTDIAGQSNYATGYEFGGAPGDTCTTPASNNNCAFINLGAVSNSNARLVKTPVGRSNLPLPANAAGDPLLGAGAKFAVRLDLLSQGGVANTVSCDFFDPAQQRIDPTATATSYYYANGTPLAFTVQYTNRVFADDAARAAASCGVAGDNSGAGPWFDSVAAVPGGVAAITGYRFVYPSPQAVGTIVSVMPFVDVATTQGSTVRDYAEAIQPAVSTNTANSHYVVTTFLSGTKTAFDSSGTAITSALDGQDVRFDIQPTVAPAGAPPATLTIKDTLAPCELAPSLTTTANWTMTVTQPADVGPDGLPCTSDDVHGSVLTFTSTAVVAPGSVPLLRYHVQIAPGAQDGMQALNSAELNEPGNAQDAADRTVTRSLTIRSVAEASMSKTADATQAEVGLPVGWTLEWSNTSASSVGQTQWIDALPFNGDGRGTAMHGSLILTSAAVQGAPTNDVSEEFTSAAPATVNDNPSDPSNLSGGSTRWCAAAAFGTPGCPASLSQVTAVRVTVGSLFSGRTGGVHLTAQPAGNRANDMYVNDVGPGVAAGLAQPIPASQAQPVVVFASTVGDTVWADGNRNGVQDAGEPGIANAAVDLFQGATKIATTSTDPLGRYAFANLPAGTYRVVVESASLPSNAQPSYDLDNGTTNADGDSGTFSVGPAATRTDIDFGYAVPVSVTTSISTGAAAHVGDSVLDNVTFSGVLAPPSGSYLPTRYGPVAPVNGSCSGVSWAGAPAATFAALTVAADGTQQTSTSTFPAAGCYSFGGTFSSAAAGTTTVAPGLPLETVRVTTQPARVTTSVSTVSGPPAMPVSDTVQLGGTFGASGQFTWTVLGPVPSANGSNCTGVSWTGAPVFATGTVAFSGDSTYQTPSTNLGGSGCYTYVESVPATSGNSATSTAPGSPTETTFISFLAPLMLTTFTPRAPVPGDQVHDHVVISFFAVGQTTLTWQLLGPLPPVSGSCAGVDWSAAPTLASGTMSGVADGFYDTPPVTVPVAGCYSYTDTLAASPSSTAVVVPAGQAAETALVNPFTPNVTTQISATAVPVAATVHDVVTLSNTHGAQPSLGWTLLGPVAPVGGSCAGLNWSGAATLSTGTMPTTGDGQYLTPDLAVPSAGCFSYVETIGATPTTAAVSTSPGAAAETVLSSQTRGALSTAASVASAHPSDSVTDTVTVTMGAGSTQLDWALVGPVPPVAGNCAGANFGGAPTLAGGSLTVTAGQWTTPASTVLDEGCYSYTESLHASASTTAATSAAGSANETMQVTTLPARISTSASSTTAQAGKSVTDAIELSGTFGATGTMTWQLLGPVPTPAGVTDCSGIDWTGAPVAGSGTVAFTGDGTYTTAPTTLAAAGCYSYVENVPATPRSGVVSTTAGDPTETVYAAANVPTVSTTFTGTGPAVPGQPVHDEVVVTGLHGAATSLDWQLLGPVAAVNGSCAGIDWTAASVLRSGSTAINGDGAYATPAGTVPLPGCYTFADTLESSSSSITVSVPAGMLTETARVIAFDPTISTTASATTATSGDRVHDTVQLGNLHGATSTMSWTLLGPVAPVNGSCSGVSWAAAKEVRGTARVRGDGSYVTPNIELASAGCYTYSESLDATQTTTAATSRAGQRSETVLVHNRAAAASGPGGRLASTGGRVPEPLWLGIGGLALGVGLLLAGARSRRDKAA